MKKILFLSFLALGGFITASAQSYYPDDRYAQQQTDEYYYYPEDNVYYYPSTNNYIYYDQNRWCSGQSLPRYFRFNNSGFRVSINYRGNSIWQLNNNHIRQYRNYNNGYSNNNYGRYNNNYQRRNSYGNSYPGKNNRNYNERSYNQKRYDRGYGSDRRRGRH